MVLPLRSLRAALLVSTLVATASWAQDESTADESNPVADSSNATEEVATQGQEQVQDQDQGPQSDPGAASEKVDRYPGFTALFAGLTLRSEVVALGGIRRAIQAGASPCETDRLGIPLLLMAVATDMPMVVEYLCRILIAAEIHPASLRDRRGRNILDYIREYKRRRCERVLARLGIAAPAQNKSSAASGCTFLREPSARALT